jgi:hypothetical protein
MWANTCWGLFGIGYGLVLAMIGLSPEYAWLQPWFHRGAWLSFAASALCFSWPLWRRLFKRPRIEGLFFDCRIETFPTHQLPNKVLRTLEIKPIFEDTIFAEHIIPAGEQTIDLGPQLPFRCEITNYIENSVFDIDLNINAELLEAIKEDKNGGRIISGETKLSGNYVFKIAKIDSGPNNSFFFYITNKSPYFVYVKPNDTTTLRQFGRNDRETVPVRRSKDMIMSFTPI